MNKFLLMEKVQQVLICYLFGGYFSFCNLLMRATTTTQGSPPSREHDFVPVQNKRGKKKVKIEKKEKIKRKKKLNDLVLRPVGRPPACPPPTSRTSSTRRFTTSRPTYSSAPTRSRARRTGSSSTSPSTSRSV